MPRAIEEEQYLQHANREPGPCCKCPHAQDCGNHHMACEVFFRFVRKEDTTFAEQVPNGYWFEKVEAE